jgi:hypothetical protein
MTTRPPARLFRCLLALALIQMAACATASKTYTADGRAGYDIHCNGAVLTWAAYAAKAGEMCETHGYDVLEKHT